MHQFKLAMRARTHPETEVLQPVQPIDYSSTDESSRSAHRRSPAQVEAVIEHLVIDLRPTPSRRIALRLAAGIATGEAVSVAAVGLLLGYRPDMAAAILTPMFWMKLAYALALGLLALATAERLAQPGVGVAARARWLPLPLAVVAVLAALQLSDAPPDARLPMVMGGSAAECPWLILAFAAPPLVGLVAAARTLAPTRLRLAGAAIGLAAGGLGAAAYAFHCPESTAPFLVIWYSFGIGLSALTGALVGPRVLRW